MKAIQIKLQSSYLGDWQYPEHY